MRSKLLVRAFLTVTGLLCLLNAAALCDESFRCVVCQKIVSRGYNVNGKFYCHPHLNNALPKCHNCGSSIQGNYVAVSHRQYPVCMTCREGVARCFLCTLPADQKRGGATIGDGRSVCAEHMMRPVTKAGDALRIYRQARAEVSQVLGRELALPKPVKAVKLVDLKELERVGQQSGHQRGLKAGRVLGITSIVYVKQGQKRWLEPSVIHLLNYVPAERMVAVAAHEYAHVWHAENHRDYAQTKPILREGFAEWVAYKVAEAFGRTDQMRIMDNPGGGVYYQGLRKFRNLERQRGVQGVLNYAKQATTI